MTSPLLRNNCDATSVTQHPLRNICYATTVTQRHTYPYTHLLDERVVVDLDVDVDGRVGERVKHVAEERDALVLASLTETL